MRKDCQACTTPEFRQAANLLREPADFKTTEKPYGVATSAFAQKFANRVIRAIRYGLEYLHTSSFAPSHTRDQHREGHL